MHGNTNWTAGATVYNCHYYQTTAVATTATATTTTTTTAKTTDAGVATTVISCCMLDHVYCIQSFFFLAKDLACIPSI